MRHIKVFALLGIILSITAISSCSAKKEITQTAEPASSRLIFPLDWIGHYEGMLKIYSAGADITQFPMQLIIGQSNAEGYFPWTIIYKEDDIRPYGLEAVNPETGHYRINEYNSIILDGYLRGNHFISKFSINDSELTVDYEKTTEGIEVSFYVSSTESSSISGGEIIAQDTFPVVESYPMHFYQKAILKKKE